MLQLTPTIVQSTIFDAFSGKEFLDADGLFSGFYVVATGPVGWRGADIYYSADGGTTWTSGGHIGGVCSFGICNSALTNGAAALSIDTTDTLDVQLYNNGQLASCSANDLANGVNGALVGGELVSFLNVAPGSDNLEFLLTTITRGQRGTNTSGHVIGERFWLINSAVARVQVAQSLIGDSVLVVAVGYGQSITDADVSPVSVVVAGNNYPYLTPAEDTHPFTVNFDGGGSVVANGSVAMLIVPYSCTITDTTIVGDVAAGTVYMDIWRCTYAQYDAGATHPVVGDSIVDGTGPNISAGVQSQNTVLTGWTVTLNKYDVLWFKITSIALFKKVTCLIRLLRTD